MAASTVPHAASMPQHPADSRCPRCHVNYRLTVGKHLPYHKREPVLLSCGHAVCEACLGLASHTCIICKKVTTFDKQWPLGKHLYILGGLYSSSRTEYKRMITHYPKMHPQPKTVSKDQCQECCQTKATVLCTTCTSQLCEACFKKVHLPRTMKTHTPEPLSQDGPWQVKKCPDHPRDSCSLLCHTCSSDTEKYICTKCHIMGSHQQHEVIDLEYLNSLQVPQADAALCQVEALVEVLQARRNSCRVLMDDLGKAHQVAVAAARDIASLLHGLLQLREEELTAALQSTATTLLQDLAKEETELEKEIVEHTEMIKEARAALRSGEEACHAGRLLGELRRLLESSETGGSDTTTQEHTQKHQEAEAEKDKGDKKPSKSDTLDEIAGSIASCFDMTSVMKTISEQFSLPSVSQLLHPTNKDCLLSSSGSTPEEAINGGRLTPAHLQVHDSPPDTFPKSQGITSLHQDTVESSILPLMTERKPSQPSKSQSLSTLPLKNERDLDHIPSHQASFAPLLQPEKDITIPVEAQKDLNIPTRGTKENSGLNIPSIDIDTSDDGELVSITDTSSTVDLTHISTVEDALQEKLALDIISPVNGSQSRGAVPKVNTASMNQVDSSLPLVPKLDAVTYDLGFLRSVPPPSLQLSSRANRTFSTSSLVSSTSSRTSSVSVKTPSCFVEDVVEVTHIISPSFFYVHMKDNFEKREALAKKLRQVALKSKPITTPPAEGKVYIGQFNEDKKWYRVQVKTVMLEEESALVTYVDYGNKEVLPFARLRPCQPKYHMEKEPSLALACGLWEVEPARGKDWDLEAIQLFARLVKGVALQFLLLNYKSINNITKCQVDLRRPWKTVGISNDLPVSIREILVFLEHGVYTNDSPQDMYNKRRESIKRRYFLPDIPFCEMDTEVTLSSIMSPHNFHLQLASFSEHLSHLLTNLEKIYSQPKIKDCVEWNIYTPKIGMSCVAKYSGDGQWQRARVEDLPGHQLVDVKFVDFGNTERLWYHQIYKIMDEFLVLPVQAIQCKLVGIKPVGGEWTERDTQRMAELCDTTNLKATFLTCDRMTCSVRVAVPSAEEDLDLAQLLVEEHRAATMASSDMNTHKLKTRKTHKEAKRKEMPSIPITPKPLLPPLTGETKLDVARLEVLEPLVYLHVLLKHDVAYFHLFQEQLEKTMQSAAVSGDPYIPSVGDNCVVMRNKEYFRARVLSVVEEKVELLLMDCGGTDKVGLASLQPLPEGMYRTTEPFCQLVSLAGVLPPAGLKVWPGVTLDYFRRQFSSSSKKFSMVPKGEPVLDEMLQMTVLPVELGWLQEVPGGPMEPNKISWRSTNDQLVSYGLALPARSRSSSLKKLTDENDRNVHVGFMSEGRSCTERKEDELLLTENSEDGDSEASFESDFMTPSSTIASAAAIPKGWMLPPAPTDLTFSAKPCYVDSEGHIYLHPESNAATVTFIRESQTLLFKNTHPKDEDLCWKPGDPVVAQYHLDKKWYRATVNKLEKNGEVAVTFVDYGNPETVKVHEIRTRLIHTDIPVQCYKAVLNNVVPATEDGQWSTEVLEFIHLTVVEKECLVTLVEPANWGEVLKVNLRLLGVGVDVASFLVDQLQICRRLCPPTEEKEEEQNSHDVIIESEESEVCSKLSQSLPPPIPLHLPVGEMFSAQVTAIQDPAHVFLTPLSSQELPTSVHQKTWSSQCSDLKEFLECVNDNPNSLRTVSDPKVGEVYLAQFMEELWVRAEVEEMSDSTVSLLYIDFGHREKMPKENIRECPMEGRRITQCARLVQLFRVEPPGGAEAEWEAVAMKAMIDCLMAPKKLCFLASVEDVVGGMAEVELYKMDAPQPFTLAYSELVEKGIITLNEKK